MKHNLASCAIYLPNRFNYLELCMLYVSTYIIVPTFQNNIPTNACVLTFHSLSMQLSTLLVESDQYTRGVKYSTTKTWTKLRSAYASDRLFASFNMPGNVVISTLPYCLLNLKRRPITGARYCQRFLFSQLGARDSSKCEIKCSGSLERHQCRRARLNCFISAPFLY